MDDTDGLRGPQATQVIHNPTGPQQDDGVRKNDEPSPAEFSPATVMRATSHAARRLCVLHGVRRCDIPDVAQNLTLLVIKRSKKYDPLRATHNTFIRCVVDAGATSEVRARFAKKRSPRREQCSLNDVVVGPDGRGTSAHEVLPAASHDPEADIDRELDVHRVIDSLDPEAQAIARTLFEEVAPLTISRRLGMTMQQVNDHLSVIRRRFEDEGLAIYVGDQKRACVDNR